MDVHGAGIAEIIKAPHLVEQLVAGENAVGGGGKMIEKLHFLGGRLYALAVYDELIGIQIDHELIKYQTLFRRVRLVIGKGGMDAATLAAMKRHGCVYVQAVGGAGALYAASVKRVAGVSLLEEFGAAEAVWHFDVEGFRGVVAMDAHGRSLFADVDRASQAGLERLLKDLKGETRK